MENPPPYAPQNEKSGYPPQDAPQQPYYPQGPPPQQGPYQPPPQGNYPPGPSPQQAPYPQSPPQGAYPPAGGYQQQPQYQQGYPQPVGPATTNVQVQQPTTTTVVIQAGQTRYGANPCSMQCPNCHAQIVTTTETTVGCYAWLIVLIVFLVALVVFPFALLGCCFIPLCIPQLKDVSHSCPNCQKFLGKYQRRF